MYCRTTVGLNTAGVLPRQHHLSDLMCVSAAAGCVSAVRGPETLFTLESQGKLFILKSTAQSVYSVTDNLNIVLKCTEHGAARAI